jgi:replication factor C subunit 3/5
MELAAGDMRRVLNLLQSTHMAYPVVNEENVYLTAGAALPAVIQAIFTSLLNDSFDNAHKMLSDVSFP